MLSLKGIKNVIHNRKPKRGKGKGKLVEANTSLKANESSMRVPERRDITLRSKGRGTGLMNPLRITCEVSDPITTQTRPILGSPGRNHRVARIIMSETGNGERPATNKASQGTHIRVPKGVNGVSRTNFVDMGMRELLQTLARLDKHRVSLGRVKKGRNMVCKGPPRKSTTLSWTLAGNITKKVIAEMELT